MKYRKAFKSRIKNNHPTLQKEEIISSTSKMPPKTKKGKIRKETTGNGRKLTPLEKGDRAVKEALQGKKKKKKSKKK